MGMVLDLLGGGLMLAVPVLAVGAVVVGAAAHGRAKKEKQPFMNVLSEMLPPKTHKQKIWMMRAALNLAVLLFFAILIDVMISKVDKIGTDLIMRPTPAPKVSPPSR